MSAARQIQTRVLWIAERGIGLGKIGRAGHRPATSLSEQNSAEKRPYLKVGRTPGDLNS